jgi:hypothetical protein
MRHVTRPFVLFLYLAAFVPLAFAAKDERPLVLATLMQANSVYVDCVCPRAEIRIIAAIGYTRVNCRAHTFWYCNVMTVFFASLRIA